MASRAFWSEDELALLERHAEELHWYDKVRSHMPRRTEASIRKQMHNMRVEIGVIVTCNHNSPAGGDNWQEKAAIASSRLRDATLAVGVWA